MKYLFLLLASLLIAILPAQNGLEVEGSILIQSTDQQNPAPGTIRFNPGTEDFEGYNGERWVSFTAPGALWGEQPANLENKAFTSEQSANNGLFGKSMHVSGTEMIIGAPGEDNFKGHVYYYINIDEPSPFKKQMISPLVSLPLNAQFGNALDRDGDYLIVGAEGTNTAYIFTKSNSQWIQQDSLVNPEPFPTANFGRDVAICGDFAFVSAIGLNMGAGKVFVFQRNLSVWNYIQTIEDTNPANSDFFGNCIDCFNGMLAVGIPNKNGGSGAVNIYDFGAFSQYQYTETLVDTNSNGFGQDFGSTISMDGNSLIIGAPGAHVAQGKAFFYSRIFGHYLLIEEVISPEPENGAGFGNAVAVSGDYLIVAEQTKERCFVFHYDQVKINLQAELTGKDAISNDLFGSSIAFDGQTIGISSEYGSSLFKEGKVYLFEK